VLRGYTMNCQENESSTKAEEKDSAIVEEEANGE
jgi:hypothetical protein